MATTADIRNGAVILHKSKRMKVIEFQHVKPGKGGAFVRTKLKDIQTGKIIDETFAKMTKDEIAKAKGLRIKVIRFRSGMSYNDLANNSPLGRYAEGKLRLLNGHYPVGEPEVGDLIKIVE